MFGWHMNSARLPTYFLSRNTIHSTRRALFILPAEHFRPKPKNGLFTVLLPIKTPSNGLCKSLAHFGFHLEYGSSVHSFASPRAHWKGWSWRDNGRSREGDRTGLPELFPVARACQRRPRPLPSGARRPAQRIRTRHPRRAKLVRAGEARAWRPAELTAAPATGGRRSSPTSRAARRISHVEPAAGEPLRARWSSCAASGQRSRGRRSSRVAALLRSAAGGARSSSRGRRSSPTSRAARRISHAEPAAGEPPRAAVLLRRPVDGGGPAAPG
jgi:hypothetical protein